MDSGLAGKTVWITGAAGGIGRELAAAFAREGARLVLSAHASFERLRELASSAAWGSDALLLECDCTRAADTERVIERARERFGRVDVCVANAGAWPSEDVPLSRMDAERLRRTIEINLVGTALTARAFLAGLERDATANRDAARTDDARADTQRTLTARTNAARSAAPDANEAAPLRAAGSRADGAALVCIGSTAGRFGERDHADYAVAKAGLRGLVATLKNEITRIDARGRVNLIEPGWTVTAMARPTLQDDTVLRRVASTMPLRQLGRASDVASAAVFLASPLLARHISGETLGIHGGMEGRLLWSTTDIDPTSMRTDVETPRPPSPPSRLP